MNGFSIKIQNKNGSFLFKVHMVIIQMPIDPSKF